MTELVTNLSGLVPEGRAVLVKPWEPDVKESSLVLTPEMISGSRMVDFKVEVVEIGPEAWVKEQRPRAKVGDVVMVAKYSGMLMMGPCDNQQYRMVNDQDIFCRLTPEAVAMTIKQAKEKFGAGIN